MPADRSRFTLQSAPVRESVDSLKEATRYSLPVHGLRPVRARFLNCLGGLALSLACALNFPTRTAAANPAAASPAAASSTQSRVSFAPSVSYSIRSDLADERSPRISTHRLGATLSARIATGSNATHSLATRSKNSAQEPNTSTAANRSSSTAPKGPQSASGVSGVSGVSNKSDDSDKDQANEFITLTASIAGQTRTIGQEIDGQEGATDLADLDFTASRSFSLGEWAAGSHSLDLTLGVNFPVSAESDYEGVQAAPFGSAGVSSSFRGGRITMLNSVAADYVINTYTYSPSSSEINPDGSLAYSLGGSLGLGAGFRLGAMGSARLTHHLDGSVSSGFSNQQTLSWSNKTWTVALRHSNGTRPDDRETNLWFFDQVRRIVSMSITARF